MITDTEKEKNLSKATIKARFQAQEKYKKEIRAFLKIQKEKK